LAAAGSSASSTSLIAMISPHEYAHHTARQTAAQAKCDWWFAQSARLIYPRKAKPRG
jgi:hypothetical protein